MKKLISSLAVAGTLAISAQANAAVMDFIDLTQNATTGLGESAWSTLSVNVGGVDVEITATKNDSAALAYLDWGTAGLGVCGYGTNVDTVRTGSGANQCVDANGKYAGGDDNVTVDEYLTFKFLQDATINAFMFNNNHDNGFDSSDKVTIDGVDYLTGAHTAYSNPQVSITAGWSVLAGESITVAYNNEQFYVSGLEVAVPEPTTLALMGLGLAGLGVARRRKA
jgi:hypothetical protein